MQKIKFLNAVTHFFYPHIIYHTKEITKEKQYRTYFFMEGGLDYARK